MGHSTINTLGDWLMTSARNAIPLQDEKSGAMPAGHNGPYHDPETPVRNTSHWLITFIRVFELTDEPVYRQAARRALDYLMSSEARPDGYTFWHRKETEKDGCNGLIGQAWTMEALVEGARFFDTGAPLELAAEVFELHPFDEEHGIWQRVDVDGSHLGHDMTFNHQLWFAAAASMLMEHTDDTIGSKVHRFMDAVPTILKLYPSGLIYHPVVLDDGWRDPIKRILGEVFPLKKEWDYQRTKALGYHAFNLYGFAMLKRQLPGHPFWNHLLCRKSWAFAMSDEFREEIDDSPYGFPYNPPGLEMAVAWQGFLDRSSEQQSYWLRRQFDRCHNRESGLMDGCSEDPVTYAARIYEAARLRNPEIKISS